MPTYVYECAKNGHQFEVEQKMTDEPIAKCEVCGSKVQRLLFAPAIHFKGSGFHNTDYGTKKRPKDGATGEGAAKSDAGAGSADAGSTTSDSSSSTPAPAAAKPAATAAARARRGVGP